MEDTSVRDQHDVGSIAFDRVRHYTHDHSTNSHAGCGAYPHTHGYPDTYGYAYIDGYTNSYADTNINTNNNTNNNTGSLFQHVSGTQPDIETVC